VGRLFKGIFVLLIIALIGIQFIDVEKTNPPATGEIQASPEIMKILHNSCYDCHSYTTKWPWYSDIAPISWFIADDVKSGRQHLNFSEWERYNDVKKEKKLQSIWEEINSGDMPVKSYTFVHPGSELDFTKKGAIKKWVTGKGIGDDRILQ
jgi:hypothetical protein